jgi:hypothetical protein
LGCCRGFRFSINVCALARVSRRDDISNLTKKSKVLLVWRKC